MRSSTWRLEDLRNVIMNLGFVGENLHTRQIFDCKKMFDQYPNASVSMTVTPPEGEPYPGTIERDGDMVIWDVRDSDLVAEGDGEIQLVFTQEPHIARSYNARTHVCRSQVPTGSIPSGLDDYITRADQLLDQVEDTFPAGGTTGQVLAKKSDTDYDTEWVDQGGGTEDYDELENRPQIGGVTLTGNKTLHDLGAASEADVEAKYTKPETGIPASDLASGVIPDPEDLIDDNAGSGDTDKVWSADKSHALLTEITQTQDVVTALSEETDALQKDKAPVIIDHAEGNPIVLTDGADGLPVEGMKIHFSPKQSGTGNPYPPGGGINLFDISTCHPDGAYGLTGEKNVETGEIRLHGTWTGNTVASFRIIFDADLPLIENAVYTAFDKNSEAQQHVVRLRAVSATIGGMVVQVGEMTNGNSYDMVFKPCVSVGTAPTEYAPYSNIRPIIGWTGVNAGRTGANKFDEQWEQGNIQQGYPIDSTTSMRSGFINAFPSTSYYVYTERSANVFIFEYDENGNYLNRVSNILTNKVITTGANTKKIRIVDRNSGTETVDTAINYPSTVTAYAPYTGESYPVTFPDGQTVYGGTLDAVNGVLTVDMESVDMGTLTWTEGTDATGKYFKTNIPGIKGVSGSAVVGNLICSAYKTVASNAVADLCIAVGTVGGGSIVHCRDLAYPNAQDFTSAVNGQTIVYELATPIEISLDPVTITTLLGDNTIWSDANGTIELDYRADTKLFIAKNKQDIRATIAPIENGTTASKAYSAGKLFYHDGNLCKAKTSIANGATFTLNTNYQITTVADELFALN